AGPVPRMQAPAGPGPAQAGRMDGGPAAMRRGRRRDRPAPGDRGRGRPRRRPRLARGDVVTSWPERWAVAALALAAVVTVATGHIEVAFVAAALALIRIGTR